MCNKQVLKKVEPTFRIRQIRNRITTRNQLVYMKRLKRFVHRDVTLKISAIRLFKTFIAELHLTKSQ
jgi:hypothetical protein